MKFGEGVKGKAPRRLQHRHSQMTHTETFPSVFRVWLNPVSLGPNGRLGPQDSFTCQVRGTFPSTSVSCCFLVPHQKWRRAFKNKTTHKPGLVLSKLGSPSRHPPSLWEPKRRGSTARVLGSVPWGRAGSPGQPLPPPGLSFLPSSQPGHLLLVPSKRMRRGSLPLPVVKVSPAQLTPNALGWTQWPSIWKTLPRSSLPLPLEAGQKQKRQAQRAQGLCLSRACVLSWLPG